MPVERSWLFLMETWLREWDRVALGKGLTSDMGFQKPGLQEMWRALPSLSF